MLFDLFAWILITLLCYGWGEWFCSALMHGMEPGETSIPLFCFAGLAVIGVLAYYLSLAGPLQPAGRSLFFVIPLARFVFFPGFRKNFLEAAGRLFTGRSSIDAAVTVSCLLIVLLISSSPVIHPDTLNYHQFAVRIFQDYGSLKGVVNARLDLGFQSSWFAALNVFNPGIFTGGISFPLAGAVMAWFILFLRPGKFDGGIAPESPGRWFALGLLIFTMTSWTQIRLTAASASPDFITALNVMAAFYFFAGPSVRSNATDLLAALFSFAALLTKLSAFPILLIPGAIALEQLRYRRFLPVLGLALFGWVMLLPLLLRSYLESGYLLFPSLGLNIFRPGWKMPPEHLLAVQEYIRAYARYPMSSTETEQALKMPFSEWSGMWWRHLYVADKILLCAVVAGALSLIIFFRRYLKLLSPRRKKGFVIATAGIVFWFLFGPDPRFGSGFLLSFLAFTAIPFLTFNGMGKAGWPNLIHRGLQIALFLAVSGYFVYRIVYFTVPGEWKKPAGLVNQPVAVPDCTDQVKKLLFPDLPYGGALPDSCRQFRLLGTRVKEGFGPLR